MGSCLGRFATTTPNDYDEQMVWQKTEPTTSLEGSYDLIFHSGYTFEAQEERRITGRLILQKDTPNAELLSGKVEFGERLAPFSDSPFFHNDFTLTKGKRNTHRDHWNLFFEAKVIDEEVSPQVHRYRRDHADAILTINTKRIPCPWVPTESFRQGDFDLNKLIVYETEEKAKRLEEIYENGYGDKDWLCNHMGVTPEIAKTHS